MTDNNVNPAKVLITGASRGIGRALAERFARAGCRLALSARTPADLEALQAGLQDQYPDIEILTLPADLSKAEEVRDLALRVRQHWDRLDVLINNAGIFLQGALLSEPEQNLDLSLQINLYAPYRLCRQLAPLMPAGKAHIFNICSVASTKAFANCASYVISKHALLGLTRALRLELLEQGVKVTAMLPGATFTSSWEGSEVRPERLMQAEDVAEAVFAAWSLGPSTLVEEMVLRPQLGDL